MSLFEGIRKIASKKVESRPENQEGFKPIRACLVDSKNIDVQTKNTINQIKENGQFIDWSGDANFLETNNLQNAGQSSYVISEPNMENKYSEGYYVCTGIIVVGEEKNSDKQISFMSHQMPSAFLDSKKIKAKFIQDLIKTIKVIKNETKEKSTDVIIFGGNTYDISRYKRSIEFLSNLLKKEFNFEPTVMTGPNLSNVNEDPTEIYFDTQNRRLYIVRPAQKSEFNENYLSSELKEKSKKW